MLGSTVFARRFDVSRMDLLHVDLLRVDSLRVDLRSRPRPDNRLFHADVAKLVDARDLKSLGLARAGSTPAVRTTTTPNLL